jgi:tetratricopeptide (TPR) repeat protein
MAEATRRTGRASTVCAALAAALLPGVVTQAQRPPAVEAGKFAPAYLEMRTAEWQVAVRTHVGGQFDGPAESIAHWAPDLTRVVVDRAIRQRDDRRGEPEDRTLLVAGLILHTDIAFVERTSETSTTTGIRAWTVLDARPIEARRFSIHWGLSRLLAAALAKDPAQEPITRAWYRAVGALYQQWADLGQLGAHLAAGAKLFSNDPVLLLYEGTLHQGYADARVQSYVALVGGRRGTAPDRFGRTLSIDDADTELASAERALRRALAIDPSLVEARIRLAHVLDARGKSGEASALAREALAAPLPKLLEYYGAMVLGRSEARLGQHAQAYEAFARAARCYPGAQSAQVALSHILLLEDRATEAFDTVARALGPEAQAPGDIDPWEWYFRMHEPDAKHLLAELRTQAK